MRAAHDLNIHEFQDTLADQEWSDLDMEAVFRHCDECVSPLGSQSLYAHLRNTNPDDAWDDVRERYVEFFRRKTPPGERAWNALNHLGNDCSCDLIKNLVTLPTPDPRLWLLVPLGLLPIVCVLLFPWWPIAIGFGIVSVFINSIVRTWLGGHLLIVARPFAELARMLVATEELIASGILTEKKQAEMRSRLKPMRRLRRIAQLIAPSRGPLSVLLDWKDYVNILFLADINAAVIGLRDIERHRKSLLSVFKLVGQVDASLAIAVLRCKASPWAVPVWRPTSQGVHAEGLWHPLVTDPIGNDLVLDSRQNLLLTGDNAAGKTTFAKTIGVNVVVGKAFGMCFAISWESPRYQIRTLFNRGESVEQGVSHFTAEATITASMLGVENSRTAYLFILDEIFRGTGTVERIGIAAAVLESLASTGHHTIAATHDRELSELLGELYSNQHFTSSIANGILSFDYRLRPGVAKQRNALRLLESAGAPASVINRAQLYIGRLETQKKSSP